MNEKKNAIIVKKLIELTESYRTELEVINDSANYGELVLDIIASEIELEFNGRGSDELDLIEAGK